MYFLAQLINGLGIGSIYALIALGYSMVYGIVKLINFAHGEIIMVGGYAMLVFMSTLGFPVPLAMLASVLFCVLSGLLIHTIAYKPLLDSQASNLKPVIIAISVAVLILLPKILIENTNFGFIPSIIIGILAAAAFAAIFFFAAKRPRPAAPRISLLITAIGVSIFLQNLFQLLFKSDARSVPPMISFPAVHISTNVTIPATTFINILTSLVMMVGLYVLVNKTKIGKAMRATSEDMGAARLMGINTNMVVAFTFSLGSALAAVGAILYANTYPAASIKPTMGGMLGLKAFVAAVLGGIGSIPGAMIGAFLLGIVENMTNAYISTTWVDAIAFGALILILLFKPNGLLGKNIKEKV